jgi:hypothetical protein
MKISQPARQELVKNFVPTQNIKVDHKVVTLIHVGQRRRIVGG